MGTSIAIDWSEFGRRAAEYQSRWRTADEVLYDLCRRFPQHSHLDHVCAKVMIIGRAYATGVERAVGRAKLGGPALDHVAIAVHAIGAQFDTALAALRPLSFPCAGPQLQVILEHHGHLTDALADRLGKVKVRSFVSKYLHFHAPAVPIFDNVADAKLCRLVPLAACGEFRVRQHGVDTIYAEYVARLLRLRQYADGAGHGGIASLKNLDYFLWAPGATDSV